MRRLSTLLALFLGLAVATPEVRADEPVLIAKKKTKKTKKKPVKKAAASGAFAADATVVVHAAGYALDEPNGEQVFLVARGQKLTVVKSDAKWVLVRDGRGREAWLPALSLRAAPKQDKSPPMKGKGWGSSG